MKETCRQVLGGRHIPRQTSTYTSAIATREARTRETTITSIKIVTLCCVAAVQCQVQYVAHFYAGQSGTGGDTGERVAGCSPRPHPTVSLPRFFGRPESPGELTIDEWLSEFDVFVRQFGMPEGERALVSVDYLGGCAKEEVLCHPGEVRRDFGALVSLLRRMFGPCETVASLYAEFYSRMQSVHMGETLAEYSRALIRLHHRIEYVAPTVAERQTLAVLGEVALKHQFVVGVRDEWVRHELRRLYI